MKTTISCTSFLLALSLAAVPTRAAPGDLLQTFLNPGPETNSYFGLFPPILLGDYVVIGNPTDSSDPERTGAVYFFDRTTGDVARTLRHPGPQTCRSFGCRSMAAVGNDHFLTGGAENVTSHGGEEVVYLFGFDAESGDWELSHTFRDPTGGIQTGFNGMIAVKDGKVLIGAPNYIPTGPGRAYLFDLDGNLLQTFHNPTPADLDRFGDSLAWLGDNVLIGAYGDDTSAEDAGAAYLFDSNSGELLRTFLDPLPKTDGYFGRSMAAVGGNVVIGAPSGWYESDNRGVGVAYLFDADGNLLNTFDNPTPEMGDHFGGKMAAVGGTHVLISAQKDDTGAPDAGAAYVFDALTGDLLATFLNPTPAATDLFGRSLAAAGTDVLIGTNNDDSVGLNKGAVYLFEGPVVPEPSVWVVLFSGSLCLLGYACRRSRLMRKP